MNRKTLLDILATPSPSGWEKAGQLKWMDMVKPVSDRVKTDVYGNAWAELDGTSKSAPRVLFEAHSDEIGFIVRHVDEKGFLSIGPIGGSDKTLMAARRITIFGSKGTVPGVIGNTAIHLRDKDKILDWADHFVDIGARSAKEVRKLGVRVGHPAIFDSTSTEFHGDHIVGRALDNRIGGFILGLALAKLHSLKKRPPATTLAANCVQEEIGSHGAKMVAHHLAPSVAIVFDVTHATDTPGIQPKEHGFVELGKGPGIAHGAANHPLVVERLIEVATRKKIPLQHEAISRSTRTDADVIYTALQGIPCALISIPLRYMHSPVEMVSLQDVESAAQLAVEFLVSLSDKDTFRIHG